MGEDDKQIIRPWREGLAAPLAMHLLSKAMQSPRPKYAPILEGEKAPRECNFSGIELDGVKLIPQIGTIVACGMAVSPNKSRCDDNGVRIT